MSVVRVVRRKEHPYVMLSRGTLRLCAVSLKARGLWALCMSYPDDWRFSREHLEGQSEHDGREAVQRALAELQAAGLASLERTRGEDGRLGGTHWVVYETAALNPNAQVEGDGRAAMDDP